MKLNRNFISRMRRAARDESGAATVEAILWLPMFFYVLALSVDVTMIFHGYSRVIRAVEDVNRALSVGRIATIDEGEAKIASILVDYKGVKSAITIDDDGVIVTYVSVPVSSLMFLGAAKLLLDDDIRVQTQQYKEI